MGSGEEGGEGAAKREGEGERRRGCERGARKEVELRGGEGKGFGFGE